MPKQPLNPPFDKAYFYDGDDGTYYGADGVTPVDPPDVVEVIDPLLGTVSVPPEKVTDFFRYEDGLIAESSGAPFTVPLPGEGLFLPGVTCLPSMSAIALVKIPPTSAFVMGSFAGVTGKALIVGGPFGDVRAFVRGTADVVFTGPSPAGKAAGDWVIVGAVFDESTTLGTLHRHVINDDGVISSLTNVGNVNLGNEWSLGSPDYTNPTFYSSTLDVAAYSVFDRALTEDELLDAHAKMLVKKQALGL